MEADFPQPQLFQQISKVIGHIGRHYQLPQLVDADVIVELPVVGALEHLAVQLLFCLFFLQHLDEHRRQREGTSAGLVLHFLHR